MALELLNYHNSMDHPVYALEWCRNDWSIPHRTLLFCHFCHVYNYRRLHTHSAERFLIVFRALESLPFQD